MMAKSTTHGKRTRNRARMKDLPPPEQKLNEGEMKIVRGGIKVHLCPGIKSAGPIKTLACPSDSAACQGDNK